MLLVTKPKINLPKIKFITTTLAPGKLEKLGVEMARYDWNVIGLWEMRWTGVEEMTFEDGKKLWLCGEDSKHQRGVRLVVK